MSRKEAKSPRKTAQEHPVKRALPRAGEGKRGVDGHLAYLLRQAHAAVRQALEKALAETGITHPQFVVLTLVRAYGDLSGAEIARLAVITPQTANTITTNLVRLGALARHPDPSHGKVLRLSLTETGRNLLARARPRTEAVERDLAATLPAELEAPLRQWLVRVATDLGDPSRDR